MVKITKSIFFPPKDKALARKIKINTPTKFRDSIKRLQKDGVTLKEKKALVLAKTRAKVQLLRTNLSKKEIKQFTTISKMKLPRVSRKK